jgi:hypothetical protein
MRKAAYSPAWLSTSMRLPLACTMRLTTWLPPARAGGVMGKPLKKMKGVRPVLVRVNVPAVVFHHQNGRPGAEPHPKLKARRPRGLGAAEGVAGRIAQDEARVGPVKGTSRTHREIHFATLNKVLTGLNKQRLGTTKNIAATREKAFEALPPRFRLGSHFLAVGHGLVDFHHPG